MLPISSIAPAPYNPREISNEALSGLRESLEKFGYVDLMIVNKRTNRLIGGHQRLKILKDAGVKKAPVVLVDFDEAAEKALNLSLNNPRIAGEWTAAVIPILEDLRQQHPEYYLSLRLQELREDLDELEQDNFGAGKTLPDDIPDVPKKAVTKPGQIWELGAHRLMCGSSTDPADVKWLMAGSKAALMATDPPYCVDYTGADRPNGGKDWSDTFREIDIKDPVGFWNAFFGAAWPHIEQRSAIYFWYASKNYRMVEDVLLKQNILIHQQIIWVKPCVGFNFSVYPWRHEPCVFGWREGEKPFFRPHRKKLGTVWYLDFIRSVPADTPAAHTDVWELDYEGKKRPTAHMHPTVKPTEAFGIPMRVHTRPGDICYEPFSGSGSQIIAAERTGRRCFAMEIEPVFVDVAVERWEAFSGQKAKLISG